MPIGARRSTMFVLFNLGKYSGFFASFHTFCCKLKVQPKLEPERGSQSEEHGFQGGQFRSGSMFVFGRGCASVKGMIKLGGRGFVQSFAQLSRANME